MEILSRFYTRVHRLYNKLLFRKDEAPVDMAYFMARPFGVELFLIGLLAWLVGGTLFWIGTKLSFVMYISYVIILLGVFMVYQGFVKVLGLSSIIKK
jgi:low affinity Fe/Cu permease